MGTLIDKKPYPDQGEHDEADEVRVPHLILLGPASIFAVWPEVLMPVGEFLPLMLVVVDLH